MVLVAPEAADAPGYDRTDIGLQIYRDGLRDETPVDLEKAADYIAEACGSPVTLVEHHSDLTYWTADVRDPR